MIQDIVAAARELLEPDPTPPDVATVTKDETGAQPLVWRPRTLYVWPTANRVVPIESGPTGRQDFTLQAVYVADGHEEAVSERSADVSDELDEKRGAYMDAARHNQVTSTWDHIRASERTTPPRTLQERAVAIELSGYRILS